MHPDFAHIGDPATNLIEECAELIQALTKLQRFGPGTAPYDNPAAVLAEIADVRRRINEWETFTMTKCFDYLECGNPERCGREGKCASDEADKAIATTPPASTPAAAVQTEALRLAEEAKLWISQVCIAAHRRSPAQTKVAVEALEAMIDALAATPAERDAVPAETLKWEVDEAKTLVFNAAQPCEYEHIRMPRIQAAWDAIGRLAALAQPPGTAEPMKGGDAVAQSRLAINPTHEAADAFWAYWRENGETHKHGYYESTWGAINRALRAAGIRDHDYGDKP